MKQILQLLLILPIIVFGQNPEANINSGSTNPKHEFGLNLYSLTEIQYFKDLTPHITATHSYFNGIYYKHYFNKNGIRTSFDLFQKPIHNEWHSGPYFSLTVGNLVAGEVKIGYERLFVIGKLIPFAFADLIYNYSQEKGLSSWYGDWTWGYDQPYLIEKSEFGSAIGLGLKYKPIKNLVISIEVNYQYKYFISQDIKNSTHKNKGSNFKFNPIRILSIGLTL